MRTSGRSWAHGARLVLCLVTAAASLSLATATAASASSARSYRAASAPVPRALTVAAAIATRADRRLVAEAWALRRCISAHPRRCAALHAGVQSAGHWLASAERRMSQLARATAQAATASRHYGYSARNPRQAPRLYILGRRLVWSHVARVGKYVLKRIVPGQGEQYLLVDTQSFTPPVVPGTAVTYSVRTAVRGSSWSPERAIDYPPATTPTGAPNPGADPDKRAAPAITVSGLTVSWQPVAQVGTYVLATNVPGRATSYSEVSGTSVTPPAVPGTTVHYSVRTAVEGSAWAPEVPITYPAVTPPPAPTPQPERPPVPSPESASSFEFGLNAGTSTYEIPFIHTIGAHTVRLAVGVNSPASEIAPLVEAYAHAGIRVLLLASFWGRLPSPAEAQNVAGWAAAFGPGGSLWHSGSYPAGTAVTDIEFGNETSYTYQFSDNSTGAYASRAQTYALRFKEAATAVQAANQRVGLLAQADSGGNGPGWVDNMFAAVPDLASRVAGWVVHPYGAGWQRRMDEVVADTAAHGAPSTIPIWVTEWGLATDNGRCLSDNYGWNRCMSYAEAATTLASTLTAMRARYGSRLTEFYFYHVRDQQPSGASSEREAYFGALQSNQATKGPYTAVVQALAAANP